MNDLVGDRVEGEGLMLWCSELDGIIGFEDGGPFV